jgi:hypothetical protein
MESLQSVKKGIAIAPQVLDNATAVSYVIDTAGVDFVNVDVVIGATDIDITTLKIQESDTKTDAVTLSSPTDVTGLVYGTSAIPETGATSALPTGTDDNKVFTFFVNTQGRKRYQQLVAVAGNGTTGVAIAAVYNAGKVSNMTLTASGRGVAANLIA